MTELTDTTTKTTTPIWQDPESLFEIDRALVLLALTDEIAPAMARDALNLSNGFGLNTLLDAKVHGAQITAEQIEEATDDPYVLDLAGKDYDELRERSPAPETMALARAKIAAIKAKIPVVLPEEETEPIDPNRKLTPDEAIDAYADEWIKANPGKNPSLEMARKLERKRDKKLAALDARAKAPMETASWTGLAELFNNQNTYAFNGPLGWLKWTGSRWEQIEETAVLRDIIAWATANLSAAIKINDRKAEERWYGLRHGNAVRVLQALKPTCYAPIEQFNETPWILNVHNGLLDLKTGALTPHSRTFGLHQAPTIYDPAADLTEWERFVFGVFPDPELAHYAKVLLGYAISGAMTEQMFALFYGGGKNGKSTICNIVAGVVGDYAGDIPPGELAIRKNQGDNQPHLAKQVGKRLLFANEPPEGMCLDDSTVKTLASRDKMSVCQKYQTPFDMTPSWLLVLRANNKPTIRATDDGIWRRVREVPFSVQFAKPDTTIEERILKHHGSAVLRWLAEGAAEYAKTGLPTCKAVDLAGATYRKEQDSIEGWFSDCVVADPKAATRLSVLKDSYTAWCFDNSAHEHKARRLSAAFDKKGFRKLAGAQYVTIIGAKLT